MTKPNPMNPKGPPMRLYLKCVLSACALLTLCGFHAHWAEAHRAEHGADRKEVRRVMARKYGSEEKLNIVVEERVAREKEKGSATSLFPAKGGNPSVIKFSSQRGATYGCFSTFSQHPITLKGKQWPTVVRACLLRW